MLDAKIPDGLLSEKWSNYKSKIPLVSPANKQKQTVIIIGTGLAGASAASSMAEMGYNVKSFCFQDSPRRAHSIAAQGGINAAKNYQNGSRLPWGLGPFAIVPRSQGAAYQIKRSPAPSAWPHSSANVG